MASKFARLFGRSKGVVIGMIHVDALPGTPKNSLPISAIINKAVEEAKTYRRAGVHGLIVENMHDVPYVNKRVGPEITAAMTAISYCVKNETELPCGIQILSNANIEAIAVAKAASLNFVRVEGFVFAHIGDEGIMESCAGQLLRYRKMIGANEVLIFTDIKKKHCSHVLTSDFDIAETAKSAEYFLSDGVVVTGIATGHPAQRRDVENVLNSTELPVLIGSGVTVTNVSEFSQAHGVIVGSHFKKDGVWSNEVNIARVVEFMQSLHPGE